MRACLQGDNHINPDPRLIVQSETSLPDADSNTEFSNVKNLLNQLKFNTTWQFNLSTLCLAYWSTHDVRGSLKYYSRGACW